MTDLLDRCVLCGFELREDDHKTSEHGDGYAHDECIAEAGPDCHTEAPK